MERHYCTLHITPYRGLARIGGHIDRTHELSNVDKSRSPLNEELVPTTRGDLQGDVTARIEEGYRLNRAIRCDARLALGVVMTGSHARMKEIEADPKLFEQWKQSNLKFAEQHFGKENIVRFTVHRDEKTPHIHCVFVPVTKDGRLSAKSFVDGKEKLRAYQEAYGKAMNPFGLERGLPSEYTHARHHTTSEYYRSIQEVERNVDQRLEALSLGIPWKLQETKAALRAELLEAHQALLEQKQKNERLTRDYEGELSRSLARVQREVHLPRHAASMGYRLNAKESNDERFVMEKGKDKLLVARHANGHWTYQSVNTPADRGTIVEFMQRRGYSERAISQLSSRHLDPALLKAPSSKRQEIALEEGLAQVNPPKSRMQDIGRTVAKTALELMM